MPRMKEKASYERAIKKCVSMPAMLYAQGSDRMRDHGLLQFSEYVQHLIRCDVRSRQQPIQQMLIRH